MNKYKTVVLLLLFLSSLLLPAACSSGGKNTKGPTATVIDDETGNPIEGAVAIAIWRGSGSGYAWFEGGMEKPIRIEERLTDKDGKFYVSGYWNWHIFESKYPRLDVYKFGYVCWDQTIIYSNDGFHKKRTDFNKQTRIIRMRRWPQGLSFEMHSRFINSCTRGDHNKAKEKQFSTAFEKELPYELNEK
jgi:hypothetical protein